jgi:hypothetical protein
MHINNLYFKPFYKNNHLFSFISLLLAAHNNLLTIETTVVMQVILPSVIK